MAASTILAVVLMTSLHSSELSRTLLRAIHGLVIVVLLSFGSGCDSNNSGPDGISLSDPASLVGTYDMVTLLDKTGRLFDKPGQIVKSEEPVTFVFEAEGQTITVSISFKAVVTLTSDRYTIKSDIVTNATGQPEQTESETETGTWTLSGNSISFDSDGPVQGNEIFDTATISVDGDDVTLEDADARMVMRRRR